MVLVGPFDRPNLTYRVVPRADGRKQMQQVLSRHPNEAGIIYCLSRREVDAMAESLQGEGVRALPYHAGLADEVRHPNQDAFLNEDADVMVATVAFGMGIDRSERAVRASRRRAAIARALPAGSRDAPDATGCQPSAC